jgi:hypothetical protein
MDQHLDPRPGDHLMRFAGSTDTRSDWAKYAADLHMPDVEADLGTSVRKYTCRFRYW